MTKNRGELSHWIEPDLSFEQGLWAVNVTSIAGVDEAGRGALAGPVTAAAIIFPPDPSLINSLAGVRDSKQMTPLARSFWAERLRQIAVTWGIGHASHEEIDSLGIVPATRLAAQRAIDELRRHPQHLLIDCLFLPDCQIPQTALIKGDARCLSIASASILAKTARDALMQNLEEAYPGYGFAAHKGYCTQQHVQAIQRLGPCLLHRRSFAPLKYLQEYK
jgi:ribonuclease HII